MSSTIKNALIFLSIGLVLILVYVFFIRQPAETDGLVSISVDSLKPEPVLPSDRPIDEDFLPLLLSVKNMKLSDSIFKNKAFEKLVDVEIDLTQDGTEGRFNPFAPFDANETYTSATDSNDLDIIFDEEEEDIFTPPTNTNTNNSNNPANNIPTPPSTPRSNN